MLRHRIKLADGTVVESGTSTGNAIIKVKLTEEVNDNDEEDLMPGAASAACLEIELLIPEGGLQITHGNEFELWRVDTETKEAIRLGVFLAEQPTKSSANKYKLTAYDRMTLLDKDLSPWLREQQENFPMSLTSFIQAVCAQCGVTLAEGALDGALNTGYAVQAFYADSLTGRQLIRWAAQAACRFARMTPDGKLDFAWYTGFAGYGIGPGDDAAGVPTALGLSGPLLGTVDGLVWTFRRAQNGYFQGGLSYEDYETAPIDKVQIKQSDDDVGVIYPPDETGTNALVIQGNLLLTAASADALRPVAQALYEQLQGVTYTPLEVSLPLTAGAPAPGQILSVADAWGRTMQAYVMQRTVTGQRMTLTCTGNARRDSTAAVNSQTWQNLQGKMLELQLGVDGLKVTASELQGDYAQLELTVDGLTSEVADVQGNVSRLSQTVAGISTEVSNVQGDMTRLEQTVDGLELTVVKDGEVRTAFAADSTSVTINSGRITFSGNTLVIQSTNFAMDAQGNVLANGNFTSSNGIVGAGRNEAALTSGGLYAYRYPGGAQRMVARIDGEGNATAMGRLILYASQGGAEMTQASISCQNIGARLALANGYGDTTVAINGSAGDAKFEGRVEIAGQGGLAVARTITCQSIMIWGGDKSRVVPTSFGPLKMAAFETPEPTFADSGSGVCDSDGICHIDLDPRYAETIDSRKAMQWLVTPASAGAMWVEKADCGVCVHGRPGQAFDWLCMGAQKGFAGVYAERCDDDPPEEANPAYSMIDYLDAIAERTEKETENIIPDLDYDVLMDDLISA